MEHLRQPCSATAAEIINDKNMELAQEAYQARLEAYADKAMAEILDGEWNEDIIASAIFDHADIARLAIAAAQDLPPSPFAVRDFNAGLKLLALELAAERLL